MSGISAFIDDMDHEGRGVARVDGKVTFIAGALPGETVSFRRTRKRRRFDEAVTVEVLDRSDQRVDARCPYFGRCGGCSLQHVGADAQVELKQQVLLSTLRSVGALEPETLFEPIVGDRWQYRRKARFGARHVEGKGGVLVGFREQQPNKIADILDCAVLAPPAGDLIRPLRETFSAMDARARIPQVEVAVADETAAVVIRHLDPLSEADEGLLHRFADAHRVRVFLQPGGPDSVVPLRSGDSAMLSYRISRFDLTIQFEATDFVQVNASVNEQLVARAVDALECAEGARVLDLFCGLGNFSLAIAREGGAVTGLELSAPMIARARANAALNKLSNAHFETADLFDLDVATRWLAEPWDAVLLDPPRSGAANVVEALRAPFPERIVYVSCNPGTLARDAAALVQRLGYRLARAGVADMFPHTSHIESLAVFDRRPGAR